MNQKTDEFIVNSIKVKYETKSGEQTDVDKLKKLDKKVKKFPAVFSYIFGTISTLIMGTGMCFALKTFGSLSTLTSLSIGIPVGIVGIGLMISTNFIYNGLLNKNKKKYGKQIIELSDKILKKD